MSVKYRPAQRHEAPDIADLMQEAAGGLVEFILHDLVRGQTPAALLALTVSSETSKFSYRNCIVAVSDGEVVGELNAFPVTRKRRFWERPPRWISPLSFLKLISRVWPLRRLEAQIPADSYYINSLAVASSQRGRGVGSELIRHALAEAWQQQLAMLSLHVWEDNRGARRFYERLGFKPVATCPMPDSEFLPHTGGQILMTQSIS